MGEVSHDLGIAPSTVSHHIRELRQSGLIRLEKHGKCTACCVDMQVMADLALFFGKPALGGVHKS